MSQTAFPEARPKAVINWKIAVTMGIAGAILAILIETLKYKILLPISLEAFTVGRIAGFFMLVGLFMLTGLQTRKAAGGLISIRDVFATIFISILIMTVARSVYLMIYNYYIDPASRELMRVRTLEFFRRRGLSGQEIAEKDKGFREEIGAGFSIMPLFKEIATDIVQYSIFGFIAALIVRRETSKA